MMLVEINAPAIGGLYHFELEESASVAVLIKEITTVICQKEHCAYTEEANHLRLYSKEQERQLMPGEILGTTGVQNGHSLILL